MQMRLITNQIQTEETETNLPTDPTTTNRKTTPPLKPKPHLIPRFPKTTPPNQQKRKRKKKERSTGQINEQINKRLAKQ